MALNPHIAALRDALAHRDREAINRAVEALLISHAPLGPEWKRIAQLMQVSGEIGLALRAIDVFIAGSENKTEALYEKILILSHSGRLTEARDLLAALPAEKIDPAARSYLAGNVAVTLGQIDLARVELENVVAARPGWGPAWLSLAGIVNLATDPLGDRLLDDRRAAETQPPVDRARYFYALGKLYHDRTQHIEAFAAFAEGARLVRATMPYARSGNERSAAAAMTGFGPGTIEGWNSRQSLPTDRPIVVTGLPRSGTTLIEQILTSHSQVSDGGEINLMPHVAVAAGGTSGDCIAASLARGVTVDKMASLYLHLLSERFGDSGRVVDKTVENSRFIGLMAAALPDAPLVWIRRDPLDCAWSCFRSFFIHGVAWSYDLADIAHNFALEDRLFAFWQERLGDRLLSIPYAALVDAPEIWTRQILAHCKLPHEDAVTSFYTTQRVVATASALQVRQPINRRGIGVARPYRAQLQPFVDAYRSAGGEVEV